MPEITIYTDIDSATGFGPKMMRDALTLSGGGPVDVHINSQGGNVIDGLACFNLLKQYPGKKTAYIDGMALSIASVIPLACDEVRIAENAWMMIHNPNNEASGDGDDMREMATLLDGMRDQLASVYSKKSGKTPDECRALMTAETWMTGPQAVELGFADSLIPSVEAVAKIDASRFKNPPEQKEQAPMPATYEQLKKNFPRASAEFIVRCLDRGLELEKARNEFDEEMASALKAATEELTKCKAELEEMKEANAKAEEEEKQAAEARAEEEEKAAAKAEEEEKQAASARAKSGVQPAGVGKTKGGHTATDRFKDAVAAQIKAGLPRARAVAFVAADQPQLHREFVLEANAARN